MSRGAVIVAIAFCLLTLSSCPGPADAVEPVVYSPPVVAPIVDPFRPPANRYSAGNRGLEYTTAVGTEVHAAADGEVVFAGRVANSRHATLLHADGLRTSYSFLADLAVVRGQRLRRGDAVGTATTRLHFGVRDADDNYLDPARLFSGGLRLHARLVPGTEDGLPPLASAERTSFLQLVLDRGIQWTGERVQPARLLLHYTTELRLDVRAAHVLTRWRRLQAQQRECTPALERPPRPNERRIAILVGGLGSTDSNAAVDDVDTEAIGFAPGDVLRFSYAGGRVPDPSDDRRFAAVATTSYQPADTTRDLGIAADRLAALLATVAVEQPDVPIDVIAHSQGGIVARLAIAEASARGTLPADVATLVTIATPHEGTDLATAATALRHVVGPLQSAGVVAVSGQDIEATSIGQLSEVSPFVQHLRDVAVPEHVRRVSIAARGDMIVPVPRTMDDDFPAAVVPLLGPSAHDHLPGSVEATREIALAIAGRPPTCAAGAALLLDVISGEALSWATDTLAVAAVTAGAGPS